MNLVSSSENLSLAAMARSALLANVVTTQSGRMLAAGQNQFKTLWTRDFCFSVPGLLEIGEASLVNRQIEMFFGFQRADGLIPRGVDVCPPQVRVVANSVHHRLAAFLPKYESRKLKPEYYGEHRTPAFDSGVLLVLALLKFVDREKVPLDLEKFSPRIRKILDFYFAHAENGLVHQAPFSDWQDSARRRGAGLYLHVLLLILAKKLKAYDLRHPLFDDLEATVFSNFYDREQELFRQDNFNQIPLEANLWIIEHNLMEVHVKPHDLYQKLKSAEIWSTVGVPIAPHYLSQEVSFTTKLVGLKNYHDGLRWPWLMAEAARIASLQNDAQESDRIISTIAELALRSQGVGEVYRSDGTAFQSKFYRSEMPFSWSAAKILEAIQGRALVVTRKLASPS